MLNAIIGRNMKNMISEQHSITSSTSTGGGKPWPTVVKLGRHLERELGIERSNDTLSRWMAHRIAELMERAENARTAAGRELAKADCANLILRLWEKRAQLPPGAPLSPFADFLEHFFKEEPFSFPSLADPRAEPKTWGKAPPEVLALPQDEIRFLPGP